MFNEKVMNTDFCEVTVQHNFCWECYKFASPQIKFEENIIMGNRKIMEVSNGRSDFEKILLF